MKDRYDLMVLAFVGGVFMCAGLIAREAWMTQFGWFFLALWFGFSIVAFLQWVRRWRS